MTLHYLMRQPGECYVTENLKAPADPTDRGITDCLLMVLRLHAHENSCRATNSSLP